LIQKDKFNSIVNLIFPGLLIGTGVIYIISCQVGEVAVSGAALACLIGLFIAALSGKYTLFHALGLTLFGWIGFSIVYRLIGSIIPRFDNFLPVSLCLSLVLVSLALKHSKNTHGMRISIIGIVGGGLGALVWIILFRASRPSKISFLGYGYDNYGHFAQARMIFLNRGLTMLEPSSQFPRLLSDAHQGTGAALSVLFSAVDPSGQIDSQLTIFLYVTILMPIIAVALVIAAVSVVQRSALVTVMTALCFSVYAIFGYPSHIWFSGYFASSFATLLLIAMGLDRAISPQLKIRWLILEIVLLFHVYPIFGVIAGLVLGVNILSVARVSLWSRNRLGAIINLKSAVIAFAGLVSLLLPVVAIRRSYGGSQLLADGGIETFPIASAWYIGLLICLVSISLFKKVSEGRRSLYIVFSGIGMSVLVIIYSIRGVGRIQYYPVKVVIGLWLLIVPIVLVVASMQNNPVRFKVAVNSIIGLAAIPIIFSLFSPKVFGGGFMGTVPGVVSAVSEHRTEIVDGNLITSLSKIGVRDNRPILYLSDVHESELNTRWVNTLSGHWTDSTWGDWMTIRSLIDQGSFLEAESIILKSNFLLVTDSTTLFSNLKNLQGIAQICLLDVASRERCF